MVAVKDGSWLKKAWQHERAPVLHFEPQHVELQSCQLQEALVLACPALGSPSPTSGP